MNYMELDTPSLLIDRERLRDNLKHMQDFADAHGVKLRPHTKTHKMPKIAKMQMDAGACGIAVAKIGEAEFERRIYNEIGNRRPVIVGGSMASGGGHAFVVDGYDAEQDLY